MTGPYYSIDNFYPRNSAGYLLKRVHKLIHQRMEDLCEKEAISFTQWVVLALLCSGTASTAAELSREVGHDAGAMTRVIDQLETLGLLTRERDLEDRRIVKLRMTPEGKAQFDALSPTIIDLWNGLFEGFETVEIDAFIGTLRTLLNRLEPSEGEK